MNPCAQYQKWIAWQSVDALNEKQERTLRLHLETCPACRGYRHSLATITENLNDAKPVSNVQATAAFHRTLANRLRQEKKRSSWRLVISRLFADLDWRVAAPLAAGLAITCWVMLPGFQETKSTTPNPVVAAHSDHRSSRTTTLLAYHAIPGERLNDLNDPIIDSPVGSSKPAPRFTVSLLCSENWVE